MATTARKRSESEVKIEEAFAFGEMEIEQLIEKLQTIAKIKPKAKVVVSQDAEGNGFSPLCQLSLGAWVPGRLGRGEFYAAQTPGDDAGANAVCLWRT